MASYAMLHSVSLIRTDVSEEISASFIRVRRLSEPGTTLVVTSNQRTLQRLTLFMIH
jgi:archaellum biogenesis ATPase FlaH